MQLRFSEFPQEIQRYYHDKRRLITIGVLDQGFLFATLRVTRHSDGLIDLWRSSGQNKPFVLVKEGLKPLQLGDMEVATFRYFQAQHDPKPRVLVLGEWDNTQTGVRALAGINLNYLDELEVDELRGAMIEVYKYEALKDRCDVLRALVPHIFEKGYRTYNQRFVNRIRMRPFK